MPTSSVHSSRNNNAFLGI
ncbi:hypothetical protein JL09_g7078 [Pichia kudriavzevii]|uniref:Uncharacterized protein n=1 Tax=Pichia kudriavzevii TaxID=4909 RepID=A0A099NIC8_PICKU|nr:hypothetical protein JL09_g7078 [Pichia kudriavzevii]